MPRPISTRRRLFRFKTRIAERDLLGLRTPARKLDADHPTLVPYDLTFLADDGLRHDREPERASDRSLDVGDELRPICGHIQDLALVTSNVVF
jgi:hypothetical protein